MKKWNMLEKQLVIPTEEQVTSKRPEAEQENVHTWSKEQLEKLKKAEETLEEIFDKAFDEGIVSDEAWRLHEIIMDMGMALDVVAMCEAKGKDVGDVYITMLKEKSEIKQTIE